MKLKTKLFILLIVFCVIVFFPIKTHAYVNHTRAEALSYIQSLVGTYVDFDGKYGCQCVDLIYKYYDYLVGYDNLDYDQKWGDAKSYINKRLPDGWKKISKDEGPLPRRHCGLGCLCTKRI